MRGDLLYWSIVRALDWLVWDGEVLDRENFPTELPVVFVANHAKSLGPIAAVASLPVRVYPWVISDMVEWDKAAEYLRKDFVEPQLHILHPWSMTISRLIAQASVRLLRAVECIPVWHGDGLLKTYRISLDALLLGRSILVFPENPALEMNQLFLMTPFEKSFARLGELYFEKTNRILPFVPLAIHPQDHRVKVGKAVIYNPNNDPALERIRIKRVLESAVQELYLEIARDSYIGIPLPD
jgi:hypothetical protein